jgi:hypothetical protein
VSAEDLNTGIPDATTQIPAPKVMQQHEITALVTGAKQKGYEKGQQEGYEKAKSELMQQSAPQAPSQGLTEADYRRIASEEALKHQQHLQAQLVQQHNEEVGKQILNNLQTKSSTAKSKFEDYDKVVDPEFKNFAAAPEVLHYANMTDNPGEVLYDLAKNPSKLASIVALHRMNMAPQALGEIKKLSDSIKVNEMAANQPKPKAPLSQITPSTVGVGNVDEDSYSSRYKGRY